MFSYRYIFVMLAQFCAILLFLWTSVSARILVLVLRLYEQNKLKLQFCSYMDSRALYTVVVSVVALEMELLRHFYQSTTTFLLTTVGQ